MNFQGLKQPSNITDFVPATVTNDPNTMVLNDYGRLKQLQERELDVLKNKIVDLEKSLDNERQKNRDLEIQNMKNSIETKYLEKENENKSSLGSIISPDVLTGFIGTLPDIIKNWRSNEQPPISEEHKKVITWYTSLLPQEQNVFKLFRSTLKNHPLQTVEQVLYKLRIQNFNQTSNHVSNQQQPTTPSNTGGNA